MAKDVEHYHREFLAILAEHGVIGPPISVYAEGHQMIRALIEEIHDQGYVLGQLHADGIFPEGTEHEVAEREQRLGIDQLKAEAHRRADQVTAVDRVKASLDHLTGQQLVEETPSLFEGAPPIRTYADGSQTYGPYSGEDPVAKGLELLAKVETQAEKPRRA